MRFSQDDSTSSHAGTPWCCQSEKKSHDIVISSFHNGHDFVRIMQLRQLRIFGAFLTTVL